jgi:hypothetical protein
MVVMAAAELPKSITSARNETRSDEKREAKILSHFKRIYVSNL